MTAEQLEAMAKGIHPIYSGLDFEEVIASLASRVIAAEKLVEALDNLDDVEIKDSIGTLEPGEFFKARMAVSTARANYEACK